MAPRLKKQAQCQVCATNPLKYTCSKCYITYCSVPCYKEHQLTIPEPERNPPLRSLTSLKWPYVPEESAFPDPLKRDDPKDLQLRQYEAIATSPRIREILSKHENLSVLLTSIDKPRKNISLLGLGRSSYEHQHTALDHTISVCLPIITFAMVGYRL
ncbi:hypothetical protein AN958_03525 [Leucoagaricus sp. SymC.cos]|nr:hypothetical protein AN958_03525 [Leucoagaricus sp. SymC.cos]